VRGVDLVVIVVYLVVVAWVGLRLSGRQKSAADYFVGERRMPWWTVCFSVVATETSVLTVISIPGGAAGGQAFGNVELALGYVIGRVVVATVLIPLYKRGDFVSAYQYLAERFGPRLQGIASIAFVFTRLLAEGVRLFASAIPIKLLLDEFGLHIGYKLIIIVLTVITVGYTYLGGIKAVIWTDAIQMGLYLGGAILAIAVLTGHVGGHGFSQGLHNGQFKLFDTNFALDHVLTSSFALPTAIIGGAIFAMASHGSDQLIVQRILATRTLRDGQKAMIASGIFVTIQFAAFSLVGALLWSYNKGASFKDLGLKSSDNLYPQFILHSLPVGISGLLVAGILGAAMGSLSSALNSMSNSTVSDIAHNLFKASPSDETLLKLARFRSTKSDAANELVSLADYVGRMQEGQDAIYYITGDNLDAVAKSAQLEGYKAKGVEVLLLTDPVDAFWTSMQLSYDGKPLKSLSQGDLNFDLIPLLDEHAKDKTEPAADEAATIALIKASLGERVTDVKASTRLTTSASCLVAGSQGPDRALERILSQQARGARTKPILEINLHHPLVTAIAKAEAGSKTIDDLALLLLEQAQILDGELPEDPAAFTARLNRLVLQGVGAG
jgi:SSS family transporter